MRRASPGRAARIVIALMAAYCARFSRLWGGVTGRERQRERAVVDSPILGAMLAI
jgi:hypothetical protein